MGGNQSLKDDLKFATDRWISVRFAKFLYKVLKQDVMHIESRFGRCDVPDKDWLKWAADEGRVALTSDFDISKSVGEIEYVKQYKNIVILWDVNHYSVWQRFEVFAKSWGHVKELVRKTESGPAIYRVGPRGITNSDPEKHRVSF